LEFFLFFFIFHIRWQEKKLNVKYQTKIRIEYIFAGGRLVAKRIQPITAAGANNGTATTTTIHTDFLGSPVAETNAAGTVTRVERYTPYGEPSDMQLDAGPGFTGHATDVATGLTYMQQRYYDAEIGRFLVPDPVGPEEDFINHFNRYNYAMNNPVRYTDPDGQKSYLASRPLKATDSASHNYIATDAQYVGDPKATIYSFGNRGDGITGRVFADTKGPSEGTYEADKAHWASLSLDLPDKNASQINVSDEVVAKTAESVKENTEYSFVPALTESKTNSNSAASAVANKAAGKQVPVSQEGRVSPGASQSNRIKFTAPPAAPTGSRIIKRPE
jgi:RHS repeat-associated protein